MNRTFKKALALCLAVIMVLSAAPLGGLKDLDWGITASAKTVATSGSCGENVTYTYNSSTGELVISGEGPMRDYESYNGSPFYNSDIRSVVIGDGVTTIGSNSFYGCGSLTSVTIPDSVTTIDYWAFGYSTGLTSVTIPDSVTTIGESAFFGTGYYNDNANWESNVLYIGKYLIKAKTSVAEDYSIKEGTLVVANYAFRDCTGLTSVTIPDSVTTIGSGAFYDCTNLTSVTIGDGVTT